MADATICPNLPECPYIPFYDLFKIVVDMMDDEIKQAALNIRHVAFKEQRLVTLYKSIAARLRALPDLAYSDAMQPMFIEVIGILNEHVCPIAMSDRYVRYPLESSIGEVTKCEWVVRSALVITELADILSGVLVYARNPPEQRRVYEEMGRKRIMALGPLISGLCAINAFCAFSAKPSHVIRGVDFIAAISDTRFAPVDASPGQMAMSKALEAERAIAMGMVDTTTRDTIANVFNAKRLQIAEEMGQLMKDAEKHYIAKLN